MSTEVGFQVSHPLHRHAYSLHNNKLKNQREKESVDQGKQMRCGQSCAVETMLILYLTRLKLDISSIPSPKSCDLDLCSVTS